MSRRTTVSNDVEKALEQNFSKPNFSFKKRDFKFTKKQTDILGCLFDEQSNIVIIDGPAGSGKSYLAIYAALQELSKGNCDDILYLRTVVESAARGLGFLKGELSDKFMPYRQILNDKVEEIVKETDQTQLLNSSCLDAMPLNYIRGASWRRKQVILDEHQNVSFDEMKTLMTRIGKGSKLIMCGDSQQTDIKKSQSGIRFVKEIFDTEECREKGIHFFQLTSEDVVRSEIVKFIVKKFEEYDFSLKDK